MKGAEYKSRTGTTVFNRLLTLMLCFFSLASAPCLADIGTDKAMTGRGIMDEVFNRHELFPYAYEEQTIILTDNADYQDVRKVRRFSRIERDNTLKYLLIFDYPAEIRGVALRVIRQHKGPVTCGIYLPAVGEEFNANEGYGRGSHVLGTDFALEDLTELLSDFQYVRMPDQTMAKIVYFVVDAFPRKDTIKLNKVSYKHRHFIRQDNFFIIRTDYFDYHGHFFKRLTRHDLKNVSGNMWRANMILMDNQREQHKTLIKIDRRIFSQDYVPPEIFTTAWLQANKHIQGTTDHLSREILRFSREYQGNTTDDTIGD
ncbi:outer membrane lipoprotein-sorting protein [Desulfobacula sp.]|uniref:outer membrane lipoprotein-sorting protein n=1 Tax=Desulfobacula sp. TaxID=2593537 RepID=UPI00262FF12E|nr:outer membrane lipoprotein-sorting protein [Desulfobacula sp.]